MASPALSFKDHWKEQRLFQSRVIACALVVLALTTLLVVRLVQLQIVDSQRFSEDCGVISDSTEHQINFEDGKLRVGVFAAEEAFQPDSGSYSSPSLALIHSAS